MLNKSQDYLRLAVAAAALLIGASVAYHYVVYIPSRDVAKDQKEQMLRQAELDGEKEKKADESKAAFERKTNYKICISSAESDYRSRWDQSCQRLSNEAKINFSNCVNNGMDGSYCGSIYKQIPAANCSLPNKLANDYDEDLRREKQRCLDEARSGVSDSGFTAE